MLHEVKEYALMEFAGLIGHLMKNCVDSLELLGLSKLLEDSCISGIIVVKTLLFRYHVKYFQGMLWISLTFD